MLRLDFEHMLLLTYTPREDSHSRGYEDWLRRVDNPFFNSVPGIREYTNWKLLSAPDPATPYTHFDFMGFEPAATVASVWSNPRLAEFAAGWTRDWGRYPAASAAEMGVNYHVYRCTRDAGDAVGKPDHAVYMPCTTKPAAIPASAALWRVEEALVGDRRFEWLLVRFIDRVDQFAALARAKPPGCHGAALVECVARPH
jgi:hypothetical protein